MPTRCLPLSLVRGHRLVTKPRINTDSVTTSSIGDRRALHDLAALSLGDLHHDSSSWSRLVSVGPRRVREQLSLIAPLVESRMWLAAELVDPGSG